MVAAIEDYGWFARNDAYVDGGAKAVATVSFKDSPKGLFGAPPKCYMHRQASFIPAFFPEGKADEADFFYFPAYASKKLGNPVLGGGTIMTITKDSKGAKAFIEYLQHPQAHELWMEDGGFLTPLKTVDLAQVQDQSPAQARRDPAKRHHLPLRRFRPDARRRGCRQLLERHGQLLGWPVRSRSDQ